MVVETYELSIELRPLLGWSSVEGGFQPMFYDIVTSCLITAGKAERQDEESRVFHLGDSCVEEVTEIRAMLVLGVVLKARALVKNYTSVLSEVALHESAKTLLERNKIPFVEESL